MRLRLSMVVMPPKLKPFKKLRQQPITILDVGCGNHSPSVAKHWFPNATYHAIDCVVYNNEAEDVAAIDRFYQINLQIDSLDEVPDDQFDAVIMAHVIEHISNGENVIRTLSRKLRPGGRLYVECPSKRSLTLPSGVDSLNFHDDPSHVRMYSLADLRRACESANLKVLVAKLRRDPIWMGVGLLQFPKQVKALVAQHKPYGPGLWDLLGFAHYVLAEKPLVRLEIPRRDTDRPNHHSATRFRDVKARSTRSDCWSAGQRALFERNGLW